jgi:hypothetical protein
MTKKQLSVEIIDDNDDNETSSATDDLTTEITFKFPNGGSKTVFILSFFL